ncbi:MAG: DUF2225 domain-containing protein [Lachnospiraceae bacterium]|nr:DUF2225 domain-containing protein [Lachnospiraceae bacterium]
MGILSGLEALGLGGASKVNIFEDQKKDENPKEEAVKKEIKEEDCLYDKSYTCPVCGAAFKQKAVRSGTLKMVSQDKDTRPVYDRFDPSKYDVIFCEKCGYAALTRFYGALPKTYKELIKTNISANFKAPASVKGVMDYDNALLRYKLALLNSAVRNGKNSEKAYICLKTAWIYRGMEALLNRTDMSENLRESKRKEYKKNEFEYLKSAYEGFVKARESETAPYAENSSTRTGLNELQLDYLIAVIAWEIGENETSYRLFESVVTSSRASKLQKENAHEFIKDLKIRLKRA